MFDTPFYHGIIRKTIVGFGSLFSNIKIERRKQDSITGELVQTLQVPIAYAPKEKWIVRLDSDPNLENHTYTTLPRLSFEITGYSYDSTRKLNRMNKVTCGNGQTVKETNTPIPYNLSISLYILTKTQEDAMQILEQILPTFTPEYTLSINAIPSLNLIQDIPVILNNVSVMDDYEGDFQTRRFVTHTLDFTIKLNLYGNMSDSNRITKVEANIVNIDTGSDWASFTAEGDMDTGAIVENWTENY